MGFFSAKMEACTLISLCFLLLVSAGSVSSAGCAGKGSCFVGYWEAWGPCQGTCGLNFQERTRLLCCPMTVQPRTLANCVHFCNITGDVTERRYCIDCGNGTTDYNSLSCLCQPLYKGRCCQELVKCADSPCVRGTCGDSASGFVCHCEKGYTGLDCGKKIEGEKVPWQTVLGYFFIALLPICLVLSVIYVCMKCCPCLKNTPGKVDQRPKPVRTDHGIIREFSWEGVASRKSTALANQKTIQHSHWTKLGSTSVNSANHQSSSSHVNFYLENDHQYRLDTSISQSSGKQSTRPPPMSRPTW